LEKNGRNVFKSFCYFSIFCPDHCLVGELTKEAPLPKGALLKCQGKCAVKTSDLYLVAEPDTVFSVNPTVASNEIAVEQGTTYFSVSETSRPMEFNTPAGYANARETSLTGNELKGYVRVTGDKAEIGFIEGGTMQVETALERWRSGRENRSASQWLIR
jgi:hypothetical protein